MNKKDSSWKARVICDEIHVRSKCGCPYQLYHITSRGKLCTANIFNGDACRGCMEYHLDFQVKEEWGLLYDLLELAEPEPGADFPHASDSGAAEENMNKII